MRRSCRDKDPDAPDGLALPRSGGGARAFRRRLDDYLLRRNLTRRRGEDFSGVPAAGRRPIAGLDAEGDEDDAT